MRYYDGHPDYIEEEDDYLIDGVVWTNTAKETLMDQSAVREMVGNAVTKSLALPEDIRNPKNAPKISSGIEDAFTRAYYTPDRRLDDKPVIK